jgi:hypothetical protein
LDAASRTFRSTEEQEIRALLPTIEGYQGSMETIAYDCIGCKKCWGADAIIQLANSFEEVTPSECHGDNALEAKREHMSSARSSEDGYSWPPPESAPRPRSLILLQFYTKKSRQRVSTADHENRLLNGREAAV